MLLGEEPPGDEELALGALAAAGCAHVVVARVGANRYVREPVDFERFEGTVRRTATHWPEVDGMHAGGR